MTMHTAIPVLLQATLIATSTHFIGALHIHSHCTAVNFGLCTLSSGTVPYPFQQSTVPYYAALSLPVSLSCQE